MWKFSRFLIKLKQNVCLKPHRRSSNYCISRLVIVLLISFLFTVLIIRSNFNVELADVESLNQIEPQALQQQQQQRQPTADGFFEVHKFQLSDEKIDWHNYELIEQERARKGRGEQGKRDQLLPTEEKEYESLFNQNGYNAVLSDKISVNRSVKDIRHKDCQKKTYLKELPTVSVVVPFYNEHLSALMRTAHSVINRSPPELLKEVILVNDHSTKEFLYDELDAYVKEHFTKVKVIVLPERSGLILARMAGARAATGDVLVFLDSHTEANTNWLPPLLEPIAKNYKVCVCPFIDVVDWKTFEYRAQDEGKRGAFDWKFFYKRINVRPQDQSEPTEPFPSPIMAGGLFAISAKFFWELGGYDEGLDIWGGEQYELSFKIWQCGGAMYDAPCSRVGHIYRGRAPFPNPRGKDFISKNFKRVAEVWMDEYAQVLYERRGNMANVDPGDLTKQKAVREKLKCKPFKWFLEEVAPDMLVKYPPVEPPPFAQGAIQSLDNPSYCIDTMGRGEKQEFGLYPCATNKTYPQATQHFMLSVARDIRLKRLDNCMDVSSSAKKSPILQFHCHENQGNQYFKYDMETKQIYMGRYHSRCIEADPPNQKVFVSACDAAKLTQKWQWGYVNQTALANWETYGNKILT